MNTAVAGTYGTRALRSFDVLGHNLARAAQMSHELELVVAAATTTSHDSPRVNDVTGVARQLLRYLNRYSDFVRTLEPELDGSGDIIHATADIIAAAREITRFVDLLMSFNGSRAAVFELPHPGKDFLRLAESIDFARNLVSRVTFTGRQVEIGPLRATYVARSRPSPLATRLTHAALRVLPVESRARYAEEYRSELFELVKASRRAQWAWALNILRCAPALRRGLRQAERGTTGPR